MGLFHFFTNSSKSNQELLLLAEEHFPQIRAHLKQSERQKEAFARMMAPQWLKIAIDCQNLVNHTTNPKVFFPRYQLLLSVMACLALIEPYISFSGELPSHALHRFMAMEPQETCKFIQRSYDKMIAGARALKTAKGQSNKLQKYFDDMESWLTGADEESIQYLQSLKERHIPR